MLNLMEQVYDKTGRMIDCDITSPIGFTQMITNTEAYNVYRDGLAEGLDENTAQSFKKLSDNSRKSILESNNMMQFNPYETLTIPLLRKYFPRLIATQLVNVIPIDQPEVVKYFIKARFKSSTQTTYPASQEFPVINSALDISRGPSYGVSSTATVARGSNPGASENILSRLSLTADDAHIEKDFVITGVSDGTGSVSVTIRADVDGNFSQAVTLYGGGTDTVSGNIDFETGVFSWSSTTGNAVSVTYQAYASLEENAINPTTQFNLEKIRLVALLRQISAEWTLPFEQDAKALFDINLQSQIVNMIGEQIALDIDKEIITALFNENSTQNASTHSRTFDINPPAAFDGTTVQHFHDILYDINTLSAQVYDTSQMGPANVLAVDPITAAILESINTFRYDGNSYEGGDLGYVSGSLQGGKYKVLVSSVVTSNKILCVYRSPDPARAVYVYCPYVPTLLTPYPLGNVPSLTVMSRYALKSLRPEGISVLTIVNTG